MEPVEQEHRNKRVPQPQTTSGTGALIGPCSVPLVVPGIKGKPEVVPQVPAKHRFALVLETPAEDSDRSYRRLRAALKCLIRSFQLRCVRIDFVNQEKQIQCKSD